MREITLDTETTGLRISDGHRIIEIGCIELINRRKTGENFHAYVNPKRPVDRAAFGVHGISNEFLQDKKTFKQIAIDFLKFINKSPLIIHNAPFDIGFINNELALIGLPLLKMNRTIDTLKLARRKYPGSPASLDALCRRFMISTETRSKHGALLDADLLASVYISMQGLIQSTINISTAPLQEEKMDRELLKVFPRRSYKISIDEELEHKKLIDKLINPIWNNIK